MDIPTRVLVAYASEKGSTREIAYYLADKLRTRGFDVDVRPLSATPCAAGYEALVLGSAIRDDTWLPEARRYLRDNREVLSRNDVWMFSVGMTAGFRGPVGRRLKALVPIEIATLRAEISPRGFRSFGGQIEREALSFAAQIAYFVAGGRYGDLRDWVAIGDWASEIADAVPQWQPFDVAVRRRAERLRPRVSESKDGLDA